eukprot:gene24005-biopygen19383
MVRRGACGVSGTAGWGTHESGVQKFGQHRLGNHAAAVPARRSAAKSVTPDATATIPAAAAGGGGTCGHLRLLGYPGVQQGGIPATLNSQPAGPADPAGPASPVTLNSQAPPDPYRGGGGGRQDMVA